MSKETTEDEIIEAMIRMAGDIGSPEEMYHPDYGQIMKDGEWTEAGKQFLKDNKDKLNEKFSQ